MASLLFRLRNVPDDEAEDVRRQLNEQQFEFYETSAGNWNISMPGIWLQNEADLPRAQALLDDYQQQRSEAARERWRAARSDGSAPRLLDRLLAQPLLSLGLLAFCLLLLYFSIKPFFQLLSGV